VDQRRDFDLLRWEDLEELPADLIIIGSHGTEHRVLPKVSDAALVDEIEESKNRLEQKVGRAIQFFSYPNGRFDDRVVTHASRVYRRR